MKLSDSFKLSLNSITHRKLRSWLTLLGIIIGVAAVVSIISVGDSAQASVGQQLSGFGADIITMSPGFSRAGGFGGFTRGGRGDFGNNTSTSASSTKDPTITKNDVIVIRSNPNVAAITEVVSGREDIVYLAEKSSASIEGVNPNTWKDTTNVSLAAGRYLTPSDSTGVVIGNRLATSTFKQPITLGRIITVNDKPFTVVGILASSGTSFGGNDSTIYMTLDSAWQVTDVNKDDYSSLRIKVTNAEAADETLAQLTQSLLISRKVTERTQNFTLTSSQAIREQVASVTQTLTLFLGAIAAISLIVGAVGVANSMFTSVLEKTKIVGVLKALGSTDHEVLMLFVIESGMFGLVGGIIGGVFGTIISFAISGTGIIPVPLTRGPTNYAALINIPLLLIAIIMSTIIGIIAGIVPARTASKLKPVDALRYE